MLESTSYAILPSKQGNKVINWKPMQFHEFEVKANKIVLQGLKQELTITFVNNVTVYIHARLHEELRDVPTLAVMNQKQPHILLLDDGIQCNQYQVKIVDHAIHIYKDSELYFSTLPIFLYTNERTHQFIWNSQSSSSFYGLGEKTGFLNKAGSKISNWNTDIYLPHNKDTVELYQSTPFLIQYDIPKAVGIYMDNSFRTTFDMQTYNHQTSIELEDGQLHAYIILGDTLRDVVKNYTKLTGTTPLPPKWTLGYHQSRYSYESSDEVRQIAQRFKQEQIPLDCIFLDIHYMQDYKVFTFHEKQFKDYQNMMKELLELNIDVVPIVDPGIKKDSNYPVYKDGIQNKCFSMYPNDKVYYGEVWPGVCAFPDFFNPRVQAWWADQHKIYTEIGIRGIWNDMNEPAIFNELKTIDFDVVHNVGDHQITHYEAHNLFALYMSKATFDGLKRQTNQRPFVLSRSGFAGIQRYATVWTGDNRSFWEHLEMSIPMILNLGMSGVAFAGADVGGFSSDTTPELLVRWTQLGACIPYFRNHSIQEHIYQEPWAFNEETKMLVKQAIELRYQLIPYIYTLFRECEQTGAPIVRAMIYEYPHDKACLDICDQFMLGSNLLIAPVLRPAQVVRNVYLPTGLWYDYKTKQKYEGGKYHMITLDKASIPIFVKAGTLLPLGDIILNTKVKQPIEFVCFEDELGNAYGSVYEDDGISYNYTQKEYCFTEVQYNNQTSEIKVISRDGLYPSNCKNLK